MDNNQVLLVIDVQKGLLDREVYEKEILIENIKQLTTHCRKSEVPVIYVRHTNNSFSKENTPDWQICDKLEVREADYFVNKTHSSVFKEKQFIKMLKDLNIKELIITGLVSNGCVQAACLDGMKLGFSVTLIRDAHSTFHKDAKAVIQYWNRKLEEDGVKVITTEDLC